MIIRLFLNKFSEVFGKNLLRKMMQTINKSIVSLCNKFWKMEVRFSLRRKLIFLLLKLRLKFRTQIKESKKLCWISMMRKRLKLRMFRKEREWASKVRINSNLKLPIFLEKYSNPIKGNPLVYSNTYLRTILLHAYLAKFLSI